MDVVHLEIKLNGITEKATKDIFVEIYGLTAAQIPKI